MRVFIAFCTLFSLALAASVIPNLDDCPPGESSGYGDPLPIGNLVPTGAPATSTTSSPIPSSSSSPDDLPYSCHSGSPHCCNSVYNSGDKEARDLVTRMGPNFARQLPNIPDFSFMGLQCVPVPVEGMSTVSCTSEVLCCQNSTSDSLVYLGCNSINIG